MSQHSASAPQAGEVKPEIKAFFERFYAISDTPDDHEKYADMFTENAKLIMASNAVEGRDAIIQMRYGMWEKVAKRSHVPQQLYPFGSGSDDIMLYGTVDYELKDGKSANVEWAARAHFTNAEGDLKMDFYQVYLDTAAMSRAK
ncbi:hypothetical protein CLAFUW4_00642 [Fulvia fulva]|uniref:SnoaL-like domain-containing protein n=1 Tax=Passalora fulva TaxID=5499 RepID=A0A9Q8L8C0_PASFU|nr:uncharacterized protein CLAFUR5_00641 [Fulvia fulva]KAK4635397.1 hypothetical protein CLAFUR4_00643 [Fulvia fulva]KAK4636590.1 hypothetical protein CLAFUR0_00644 [Fulvia fulva]UJO12727.1 hypothetical protein CLAFUR5_00641 [Fulvia fulva]WPV08706.1 hypothetical protein CLAFUW4_00642 [Fulvia fulva]WPV23140.1 hypothetical protein CLAFUW7_00647 [Fulvia fulva]